MTSTAVQATYANGSWHCYHAPDGRTPQLVGCSHRTPRKAVQHAKELTERASASQSDQRQPRVAGPTGIPNAGVEAAEASHVDLTPPSSMRAGGVHNRHRFDADGEPVTGGQPCAVGTCPYCDDLDGIPASRRHRRHHTSPDPATPSPAGSGLLPLELGL